MNILNFWKAVFLSLVRPLYFDAPDPDPAIGQAAAANSAISAQQLAFSEKVYEEGKPRQARLDALTDEVVQKFLQTQDKQGAQADDYYNYMKSTFRPLEQQLSADAQSFDTEAKRNELAGAAAADVEQMAAVQDAAARRDAARFGVNPGDAAFAENLGGSALNKTILKVGAANNARTQARAEGRAFKFDAAGLGRNLPSAGATSAQIGLQAGNQAVNAGTVAPNNARADAALMNQGSAAAIQGNNATANIYSGLYGMQSQQAAAGIGGIANLAGTLGSAYILSSKKAKVRKGETDEEKIVEAVKKTPVDRWQYKQDASPDQQEHIGPYAEDFKKNFGVGDGKRISVIDAVGVTFAAVKGLAKQVERLQDAAVIAKAGVANG